MFQANFLTVVLRLYLMMAVVIAGGFLGWAWLQMLALPIFPLGVFAYKIEWKRAVRKQSVTPCAQSGYQSQRLAA